MMKKDNMIDPYRGCPERMIAMRKVLAIFTLLALACIPLASFADVIAYDGEVEVDGKSVENGQAFTTEVTLSGNDIGITAMKIPLVISHPFVYCTGVDFTGAVDPGNLERSYEIDGDKIYIYYTPPVDEVPTPITDASVVIATLNLHVTPPATDYIVTIGAVDDDISFEANGEMFTWWNRVEFADGSGANIALPDFSPGMMIISQTTDTDDEENDLLPDEFELAQNYPNPFNPATVISFALPEKASIHLDVFNLLGQKVAVLANGEFPAGRHEVKWDGVGAPSGVYFYRLTTDDKSFTRKMMLLK